MSSVSFPAFITNSSDNFTSNWATEQPYGFQDMLGIFQGTSRKITVGLKVVPESVTESAKRMAMLNKIVQSLYPAYTTIGQTGVTVPASSPIVGIKMANLIQEDGDYLYGWLDGFNIAPNFGEAGAWRINNVLYPLQWDVTFAFNVIHKKRPGFKGGKFDLGNSFPAITGLKAAQVADAETETKTIMLHPAHVPKKVGYKWNDTEAKKPPSKTPQQQVGAVFGGPPNWEIKKWA